MEGEMINDKNHLPSFETTNSPNFVPSLVQFYMFHQYFIVDDCLFVS